MKLDRVAAAPISWGVCEVPGWGVQLDPAVVLSQIRDLGLHATEFGPVDFLPAEPTERTAMLATYELRAVGGFLPVVLHDANTHPGDLVDRFADACVAAGGDVVVLAAASGASGYDLRAELNDAQWSVLLDHLDEVTKRGAARGVVVALHPHVGTMVQTRAEVDHVLTGSDVGLCLDTGHLLLGGTDPVALVTEWAQRVLHVHLKDVDAAAADQVRTGASTFAEAVRGGLFRPLGKGDIDIASLVRMLERAGYEGWYVLEQDVMLQDAQPDQPLADAATSINFLRGALG
ncbi:MAG: TIM barrel protein [Nocardioidaceae bacterium]|jgi:inosose dehydratase|nr:TIM barrel protein [Nocardioidaceae bacterium]MDQ3324139.1 TIM barrel protein [Actinomycetota bacterium]